MVEANKNENFDDSFESDDFAFLEEDEIKAPAPANGPAKKETKVPKLPIKWLIVGGVSVIFGGLLFNVAHKKPAQDTTIPVAAKELANKETIKSEQTITVQVQPQKQESGKDSTVIIKEKNTTTTSTQIGAEANHHQVNTSPTQTSTAATNAPSSTNIDEKSRAEMADLFAATSEQPNNLATALAQEEKKKSADKASPNMDLYFGNNVPNNRIDKKSDNAANSAAALELAKQTTQLQQAVESMSQEMTENVNHLKQLETKINELNTTLAKVNQNIGAMDARILGVTETIDSLTQDVSHVKKVIAEEDLDVAGNSHKSTNNPDLTYKPPGYSIHAIIPGRAWLKSSSGQIITIAEGDPIGDYGTVAVIDAANNIVRTSSGVSFR